MAKSKELEIISEGNIAVVSFYAASMSSPQPIAKAGRKISEFIEQNHPKAVVFDFSRVKFFSSQLLGLLLDIRAKLKNYGGVAVISAIDPNLHRVFKITNLDKIFEFFPDRKTAVKSLIKNLSCD